MKVLLNDASVLLNLVAAECLESLVHVTGWQLAICPSVRDEVKKLRDADTGEMVDVDITPYIDSGLLQVIELSGDREQILYIEQAMVVDDGEAMSIAIAASRRLELAIDDKRAENHTRRSFPELALWTTPEILKRWSEGAEISGEDLARAISLIEERARYFPPKVHALAGWWAAAKQGE